MSCKITLIGAGSVVFAKTLISDILQFPELRDATISLMDIDTQRLKVAEIMTRKIIQKLKVPAKVEATTDRRKAIKGARYVICTVQVGGYKPGTVIDFEIPKKYGLQQTIADTLGIGGIFRALRTIPVINGIAQEIAEVGAPDCMLLNYTNPMAMNCWAVDRAVGIPHVGLCHSVQGTSHQLCTHAQIPHEDVTYLVAGINHMAFFLKFEYKGQDAYPLLFKLLEDKNFTQERVRFEMMRRTGYFVTESSEHQSEYVPYFIHHGKEIIREFNIPIDEYLRRCDAIIATWKNQERELIGESGEIEVKPQSHEYGSFIIHSRETNTPRVVYGNVPNRQLITNLPEGCCVEVPCLVDAHGLQPTHIGALPPQLAAICQTNINPQALTVEAALTHKREHIYHAAMLDPHTSATLPLHKIWAMCDELIEAHQNVGLLGEFKPVIQNTGKSYAGTGDRVIAKLDALDTLHEGAATVPLQLTVQNPENQAIYLDFEITCDQPGYRLEKSSKVRVQVPAKKSTTQRLTLLTGADKSQPVQVRLSSKTQKVLCRDLRLECRQTLKGNPAPFSLNLAGFPAVEGTISRKQNTIQVTAKVLDSDLKPNLEQPWIGSCVELFLAPREGGQLTQFFVIPQKGKTSALVLGKNLKPIAGAKAKVKITPIQYHLDVAIPLSATRIPVSAKSFLFDTIVTLNALGDAHSGGRASLNGRLNSNQRTAHYSLVKER